MKHPRRADGVREDVTDLNYLFFRQQVERSLAQGAATEAGRNVHEVLATMYEKQIEQLTGNDFLFPSRSEAWKESS